MLQQANRFRGFTLIEVVAALGAFSLAFLTGFASVAALTVRQELNYQATVAASMASMLLAKNKNGDLIVDQNNLNLLYDSYIVNYDTAWMHPNVYFKDNGDGDPLLKPDTPQFPTIKRRLKQRVVYRGVPPMIRDNRHPERPPVPLWMPKVGDEVGDKTHIASGGDNLKIISFTPMKIYMLKPLDQYGRLLVRKGRWWEGVSGHQDPNSLTPYTMKPTNALNEWAYYSSLNDTAGEYDDVLHGFLIGPSTNRTLLYDVINGGIPIYLRPHAVTDAGGAIPPDETRAFVQDTTSGGSSPGSGTGSTARASLDLLKNLRMSEYRSLYVIDIDPARQYLGTYLTAATIGSDPTLQQETPAYGPDLKLMQEGKVLGKDWGLANAAKLYEAVRDKNGLPRRQADFSRNPKALLFFYGPAGNPVDEWRMGRNAYNVVNLNLEYVGAYFHD